MNTEITKDQEYEIDWLIVSHDGSSQITTWGARAATVDGAIVISSDGITEYHGNVQRSVVRVNRVGQSDE